jgi:hypothetical protein
MIMADAPKSTKTDIGLPGDGGPPFTVTVVVKLCESRVSRSRRSNVTVALPGRSASISIVRGTSWTGEAGSVTGRTRLRPTPKTPRSFAPLTETFKETSWEPLR